MRNMNVKLNLKQRMILFEAMAKNHKILEGRPKELSALRTQYVMWAKLVAELNDSGGPKKSMNQWKRSWKDLRFTTKKKYLDAKKYGGKRTTLADYEKYMIKACGLQSSDEDEPDDYSKSETPQESQSNSLEPAYEDLVSETSEISDLEPSLYCPERKIKLNIKQKRILIEAMVKSHKILEGRPRDLSTFQSQNELWNELIVQLNQCGLEKNMAQWKRSWLDIRTFLKKKYTKSKKQGGVKLTDYEEYVIKSCGLHSSDEESANPPENEAPHGSQSSVVKLEPIYDIISETSEISGLNPELNCDEMNVVKLEPMDEGVSETSEIFGLNPGEKNVANLHPMDEEASQTSETSEFNPELDSQERKLKLNSMQKRMLIEAMAENYKILDGRPKDLSARRSQYVLWKELVAQLNKCGPEKNMAQWKRSWADIRTFIRKKYTKSKIDDSKRTKLTDYEKYMIKACGLNTSDDESENRPQGEASHGYQTNVLQLEPAGEGVSETSKISCVDPELNYHEKYVVKCESTNGNVSETFEISELGPDLNCHGMNAIQLSSMGEDVSKIKILNAVSLVPMNEGVPESFEVLDLSHELNYHENVNSVCRSMNTPVSLSANLSPKLQNRIKLEPMGEAVSGTILDLNPELNCHGKNLVQGAIPAEQIPELDYSRGLTPDTPAPVENLPLYENCRTENLNVNTPCDLQPSTLDRIDSSKITNQQILTEIRKMHENLLNESKKQTALLEKICQSLSRRKNENR